MVLLPIKFRILQLINENEGISNKELLTKIKEEYIHDHYISEKVVEDYLIALKAVGMIALTDITFDEKGRLKQFFKTTNYGENRMEYIDTKKRLARAKYSV